MPKRAVNLPNLLTAFRIFLVPLVVVVLLILFSRWCGCREIREDIF